jgi:hypothetical protein
MKTYSALNEMISDACEDVCVRYDHRRGVPGPAGYQLYRRLEWPVANTLYAVSNRLERAASIRSVG